MSAHNHARAACQDIWKPDADGMVGSQNSAVDGSSLAALSTGAASKDSPRGVSGVVPPM